MHIKHELTMQLNRKTSKNDRPIKSSHCYYCVINVIQQLICCTINLIHSPQIVKNISRWALTENIVIRLSHSCQGLNSHEQFPFMEIDPSVLTSIY